MRRLEPPSRETDHSDLKASLRRYRRGGEWCGYEASDEEIDNVLDFYNRYDDACGQAEEDFDGGKLEVGLINAIKRAFSKTYEGRMLYALRNRLLTGADLCPLCGIDPADQLDHFLPKSDYEVFAIYARNLVPVCKTCNYDKRARAGTTPNEQFVHAYFDDIPDTEFLIAEIELRKGGLIVNIGVAENADISDDLVERLNYQIGALDINARYAQAINVYVGGHALGFRAVFGTSGAPGLQNYLEKQAEYEARRFHRNDWRAVVFRGLAAHEEFCAGGFLEAFPLPNALEAAGSC